MQRNFYIYGAFYPTLVRIGVSGYQYHIFNACTVHHQFWLSHWCPQVLAVTNIETFDLSRLGKVCLAIYRAWNNDSSSSASCLIIVVVIVVIVVAAIVVLVVLRHVWGGCSNYPLSGLFCNHRILKAAVVLVIVVEVVEVVVVVAIVVVVATVVVACCF